MIVVGAKGLASEVLQILENKNESDIKFYDDVNLKDSDILFNKYTILRSMEQVIKEFEFDNSFTIGMGKPNLRHKFYCKFSEIGGKIKSVISLNSEIGNYTDISDGATMMSGVKVSNGVKVKEGLLAYYNAIITHDVEIGKFVELSPGCKILGRALLEDFVHVGSGAIVLPDIKIGKNAIVGAGAVVTKNVPANALVYGNPAKIKYIIG